MNSLTPFYSNVQIYQQVQSPCIPDDSQPWFYYTNKVSTSPVPLNSPATTYQTTTGHTYSASIYYTGSNLTLNVYDVTAGGTCSPVTSGTCFTYTWYNFSIPSWVDGTTAYVGFGGSTNGSSPGPLLVDTFTYNVLSVAGTPSISPSGGTFATTQSVTISDASSGSIICYNTTGNPSTNGIGGCANGTLYTGAISVSKGETIYAVAGSGTSYYGDSAVTSAAFNITGYGSQPTYSVAPGIYQGHQTLILTTTQGGVICYSTSGSPATDGSTGCTTGTKYASPITISSNETVYVVAGGTGYTDSGVGSATYVISPFAVVSGYTGSYPANSPTFSPVQGTYSGPQSVTLYSTTSGSNICYIASATPPALLPTPDNLGGCAVGTPYAGAISVSSSTTIYASAGTKVGANVAGTGPSSSVSSATYTIAGSQAATPNISPAPGTYTTPQNVTITDSTPGATIYYTTDGTMPTTSSSPYTGPIMVSATETLEAIAAVTGETISAVASAAYTITSTPPAVSTPTFTPPAGAYTSPQSVTISDATSGATIYYTTNGTTPTTSSAVYSGPITVNSTDTLEAVAVAAGDTNSAVATSTYTISQTAAKPTFSVPGGTYSSAQSVTISDATSGATIYYTTNGSTPTTSSAVYAGPITVSSSETLEAFAVKSGDTNSAVASAAYTITPTKTVSTPTFTPPAGTYTSAQSVSISDATSGATIYYTANGTTPTTSSAVYSGPITVSSTEMLEAIAAAPGDTNSAVASAAYTITQPTTVSTPTFSPPAGTYNSAQSVSISCATSGATIYYTTNGTTPTTSSAVYSGPITVSSSETLEAIAVKSGDANSAVGSAAYTIGSSAPPPTVSTPTFTPPAGAYTSAQPVSISDATSGATIYYTTNGTTPTTSSAVYSGPITVSATETLEAIAAVTGDTNSAVVSAAYTISSVPPTVSTPTFTPPAGAYGSPQSVALSDASAGATIYYTTNGTTPTTSSSPYTGPIMVSTTETLEAIAAVTGETSSAVVSAAYTMTPQSAPTTVSTPTFTPPAGAYTSAQSVTISDAAAGATIYYTTDGTTPTTSSAVYSGPITVSSTETLEAIAAVTGDTSSAVASAAYTISSVPPTVSTPTFTPPAGAYTSAQTVSISDATAGATIYYTTDGTMPTTASSPYTGPITVSATETLETIAAVTGDTSSAVASAAYTIPSHPDFILSTSLPSLTVNSGGQGALTLTVTPVNGFDSPVTFACSGLPSGATCSFDQETVIPSGEVATTQLTISTSAQSSALHRDSRPFFPLTMVAMTVCFLGWRKRRGASHWMLPAIALASLGLLLGCGIFRGSLTPPTSATSTVTVMATSGTMQQKATIALTVK